MITMKKMMKIILRAREKGNLTSHKSSSRHALVMGISSLILERLFRILMPVLSRF